MPRCSEQSRPIRANISRTRKRRWQEGGTHSEYRLVSAESELGTLPVSSLSLRALHTRSGLGRSGGATPHPHQPCAPTVPAHRTHREGCPLSTPQSRGVPRVPSESTATALLPHRSRSMPLVMHPPTCRALGAEPTDPSQHQPHARQRHRQEGGTHSDLRLVSAESELGTLPFSVLLRRSLHTRSGLGRSAVLRRTHGSDEPLRYPRTYPYHTKGAP